MMFIQRTLRSMARLVWNAKAVLCRYSSSCLVQELCELVDALCYYLKDACCFLNI